ncbi:MAG: hypothetical protein IPP29_11035 [Bacteroidetes bacterium]|nr:hypothetical protein [Bacteroidota bacterium]
MVHANITSNNIAQNPTSPGGAPPATTTSGIRVEGCNLTELACNSVTSTYSNTIAGSYGIQVNQSSNSAIMCNATFNHHRGVFFGGVNCVGTVFQGNTMSNNDVGLMLNSEARIGQQPLGGTPPFHGNLWLGTFSSGFGAVMLNTSPGAINANLFTTKQGIPEHNPIMPGAAPNAFGVDNSGWFDFVPFGASFSCAVNVTCEATASEGDDGDAMRAMIANDSTLTSDYLAESKAQAKTFLYADLKNDTMPITDVDLQNFIATNTNNTIGYLYNAKLFLEQQAVIDDNTKLLLSAYQNLIITLSDSLIYYDNLVATNSTALLIAQRNNIAAQINNTINTVDSIITIVKLNETQNRNDAEQINDNVVATEVNEMNEKIINAARIDYESNGITAIISNYNDILSVATQCPYAGGKAVYISRNLIAQVNDSMLYDDADVCLQMGIYRQALKDNSNKIINYFEIIPNPANEKASIVIKNNFDGFCKIIIYDNINRIVTEAIFDCIKKRYDINTSSFPQGVYQIVIEINGHTSYNNKLTIVR